MVLRPVIRIRTRRRSRRIARAYSTRPADPHAVAGQDATERATQFNDAAEIDGTILAKADADSQAGAAISIAHDTGKPILFLGTG